jgi:hypothetical protein
MTFNEVIKKVDAFIAEYDGDNFDSDLFEKDINTFWKVYKVGKSFKYNDYRLKDFQKRFKAFYLENEEWQHEINMKIRMSSLGEGFYMMYGRDILDDKDL